MRTGSPRKQNDDGFGLIEVMVALSVLLLVMLGFQAMITATFQTYSQARNTTLGQQVASDQLEKARRWNWDNLGTINGSPAGTIPDDVTSTVGNIVFGVHTVIQDLLDASGNSMNLRRVEVTVTRTGTNLPPVVLATIIASPTAGSVGKGTILLTANDFCSLSPSKVIPNLNVGIDSGPSGAITQSTNSQGVAQFTQLTPTAVANPPTAAGVPQDYYSLTFTDVSSPYALVANSSLNQLPVISNAPASWNPVAQFALDPGTKLSKVLLFYKKGSLAVHALITNPDGSTGPEADVPGTVVFSNSDNGVTYDAQSVASTPYFTTTATRTGSPSITTTINPCEGNYWSYTFTPTGQSALPVTPMAEGGLYPADLVVDGSVALPKAVAQPIRLVYADDGTPVVGATIQLSRGGPKPIPTGSPLTATTDATGTATFNVQWNSNPYQVDIPAGPPSALAPTGWAAMASTDLPVPASPTTTTYTVARPSTVAQQVKIVDSAGTPAAVAAVTLSGSTGAPIAGTTDAAGLVTFPGVQPSTVPYTVTVAAKAPTAANPLGWQGATGSVLVTSTPTLATVTVALPAPVAVQVNLIFPGGQAVRNANVTVGTGPSAVSGSTDNSGQVTLLVAPNVTPYPITVAGGSSGQGNPTGWLPVADTVTVPGPTTKAITVVPA